MSAPGPMGRLTDEDLIALAAKFDTAALAELYDRHSSSALGLARRMLGPSRAEDAVQEAFTSIWRSASSFDPAQGLVQTWLMRIVRYRSLDILRRIAAEDRRVMQVERERPGSAETADAAAIRHDRAAQVQEALAGLPPDQREVVERAYCGGWTQAEIAERLGLPVGTVKSRARLALEKLRTAVDPSLDPAE